MLLILISCKKKNDFDDLIYIEDLSTIKDYMSYPIDQKSDSISWDYFNRVNFKQSKVISINPKLNQLEFVYIKKDSDLIIYYKDKEFKIFNLKKNVNFVDVNILIN
jgi:hypothetical protein